MIVFLTTVWLIAAAATTWAEGTSARPLTRVAPDVPNPIQMIDDAIRAGWRDGRIKPSARAEDGEWCRRIYLDLLGRVPTVEELEQFQQWPRNRRKDVAAVSGPARTPRFAARSSRKRSALVYRLLSQEYAHDFTQHWTTFWTNVLIGRSGGTARRSLTSRDGLQEYLREAIRYNRPYDVMVGELVKATGSTRPGAEGFNGATNFLVEKVQDGGVQATAKVAEVFLGLRVQCTQCHNHPFTDDKQNQFWELNAFFRQTRALRSFSGNEIIGVRLIDQDYAGADGNAFDADVFYQLRNDMGAVAYPVFVDGTALTSIVGEENGTSGYLEDVNRRKELAGLVRGSRYLDRAIVNRMWAHFLGYGFTKPIDDMGAHNPPSHPELLDRLGQAFRTSDFDLKELMRWITLSEAYSLSSRISKKNEADDPNLGVRPKFSHFYLRQMEAEQLYESLLVATQAHKTRRSYEDQESAKREWLQQFVRDFGTDDNGESTTFNGSISQSLMLMNGDLVVNATSSDQGSFLWQVATNSKLKNPEKIKYLYLAALARKPTAKELKLANRLLTLRNGDVGSTLQDVWWALLNSNEFILNH